MKIPNNQCQYPGSQHLLEDTAMSGGSVIYQDSDHGIPEMIRVCDQHYKIHILKYWPESTIAVFYRKQGESQIVQACLLTNIGKE
jgi:hypothetical protein